ncbi:hypothetical protein D3C86_2004580 [compost metagenome]
MQQYPPFLAVQRVHADQLVRQPFAERPVQCQLLKFGIEKFGRPAPVYGAMHIGKVKGNEI